MLHERASLTGSLEKSADPLKTHLALADLEYYMVKERLQCYKSKHVCFCLFAKVTDLLCIICVFSCLALALSLSPALALSRP